MDSSQPQSPTPETATLPQADPYATVAPAAGKVVAACSEAVPGYEILGELGRGGMGVVYKARQVALNRVVALKMILAGGHAGEDDRARFLAEAEAIAKVKHPGIVQVYDFGTHDGLPYFSLELCEGGSLAGKLRDGPLLPRDAAHMVERIAQAVHAAHLAGIVHRDLKPANVLLADNGSPRVTDFGLAKRTEGGGNTQSGAIMGTPSYMAPEQAEGKKDVGPLVDVYALGAMLYACLTGRPPFQAATSLDTILQVVADDPVPPRQLNAKVPADLETITLKCLAKEPGKRYASAQALAEDLGRYLAGKPIVARPVGMLERAVKGVLRHRAVSAAVTAAVLALMTGAAAATWQAYRADQEAEVAKANEKRAVANEKSAEEQRDRAERLAYAGKLSLAQGAFAEGNGAVAIQHLEECQWNLRGWEHRYLWSRFTAKQSLLGHTDSVTSVAYSPDGKRIVSGSQDNTVTVWDAAKGQGILTLKGHTQPVTSVAFSPDGKRVASGSYDKTVKVWDAERGQELLTLKGHAGVVWSVAFSPDGKRVASGSEDRTVKVWDAERGQELLTLKGHTDSVSSVAYSPDGKRILTGSFDTAKVWDAEKGQELLSLGQSNGVSSVAYSPDGKRIISWGGGGDNTVKVWDAEKGQEIRTLRGHWGSVTSVAYSPDDKRIFGWHHNMIVLAWSVETGEPVEPANPPARLKQTDVVNKDGTRRALVSGVNVLLIDTALHARQNLWPLPDAAERQRYHREQARLAEQEKQWFAVAFHLGRLLLDQPDDADLKRRREQARKNHHAASLDTTPKAPRRMAGLFDS